MAPLPQSVLIFTNRQGLDDWYKSFKDANTGLNFLTTCTTSESLCKEVLRADTHPGGVTDPEKDANLAGKLHTRLADLAPIYECAWTSSNLIVGRSLQWFEANQDKPFMQWNKVYDALRARLPTVAEVEQYQDAALRWRADIGYHINDLTMATKESVVKTYRVSPNIIMDIRDLLEDMKRRKNEMLGIKPGEERAPSAHVDQFASWVKLGDWSVPCPWGDWSKKNKAEQLLSTTAAAGVVGKKLMKDAELKTSLAAMVASIRASANDEQYDPDALKKLGDNLEGIYPTMQAYLADMRTKESGGFVQQGSAIDTAFSSHYWAWKAGIKVETFPSLSAMLFALGKAPLGRKKVERKLQDCPFMWSQKLGNLFSTLKNDAIHMHPGILTPGRMCSDMVCAFGAFPVSAPEKIRDGSSSPRFLLNLRSDGENPAGQAISYIFREYKVAYPDWKTKDIVPVEHMLHQSFLSKMGPFVNVSQVPGQALSVNILPLEK